MGKREDTDNYRQLFLEDTPLLDTRAPVEFARGAFPLATNIPLMNDEERHLVGIRYKESGQQAAIALGEELVHGASREQRLSAWCEFAQSHPEGYLYCFRGGLRSQTAQAWMQQSGIDYPLVRGGYKALRNFLLEVQRQAAADADIVLIAGKTGTGKTRVIAALDRAIDLEGLAVHRGSSFGQLLQPQPSQVDFENTLSIALLRLLDGKQQLVFLEDEGHLIGRISLPDELRLAMQPSRMLVVEETVAKRVEVVLDDYVVDLGARFTAAHGVMASQLHERKLLDDLARISKRLGGERHRVIAEQIGIAFSEQRSAGDTSAHECWIESLLVQYYDPMYEYQFEKRNGAVLARGSRAEITAQAQALAAGTT